MLNYINKHVYLPEILQLNWGSRGAGMFGYKGVWGGERYDGGVVMAPLHGILTKKMFVDDLRTFACKLTHFLRFSGIIFGKYTYLFM